ncbi:hypothetical protein LY78DRAFT_718333 [Colletotrichum sublineola]|nr:hypothetical protein LY78DRAFT_718333 [Colletotrichum sublineola]
MPGQEDMIIPQEPSEGYDIQSAMGSQVRFGPGAKIERVSLPNDFSSVRMWGIGETSTAQSLWEALLNISGYDARDLQRYGNFGVDEGCRFLELGLEDPHFAEEICRRVCDYDRENGTKLSENIDLSPASVCRTTQPHIGVSDTRTVCVTWRAQTKDAFLIFNDYAKAQQLASLIRLGDVDIFSGDVGSAPLILQNGTFGVQLKKLPLHVSGKDLRDRMSQDLNPVRIQCGPPVCSDKERDDDLEEIKNKMDLFGYCTLELRPDLEVNDGMVRATAEFEFEDFARCAAKVLNNSIPSLNRFRSRPMEVVPLYKVKFEIPSRWKFKFLLSAAERSHIRTKVSSGNTSSPASDIVTIELESTNAHAMTRMRRAWEGYFNLYHDRDKNEEYGRLKACCRPQEVESAVSSDSDCCPVCMAEPSEPIRSACGHVYCRECYVHMVRVTANSGTEPSINCIGEDGSCQAPFPLAELRSVLGAGGYKMLLLSVLKAHVKNSPFDLRCCPTPNCEQLYRPTPKDADVSAVARCPGCFVVLCTACHQAHDGQELCDAAEDTANKKLMAALNIKRCPQCGTWIERTGGCNHMECVCCHSHICWLCMADYSEAKECYDHMTEEHGGAFAGIPGVDVYGERLEDPVPAF